MGVAGPKEESRPGDWPPAGPLLRAGIWGETGGPLLTHAVLVDRGVVGLQGPIHHGGVFVGAASARAAPAVAERLRLAGIRVHGLVGLGVLQQAVGVAVRVPQHCRGKRPPVS